MNRQIEMFLLLLLCLFSAGSTGALGESPRRLNNEGVRLYFRNRLEDAARKFEEARKAQPDSSLLAYNQGISEAMRGQWEKALAYLSEARQARNPQIARKAQFALGYAHYESARNQRKQGNLDEAMKSIQASISATQSALLADIKDLDSRHNLDLALRLKREIQKEMEHQQQNQQSKQKVAVNQNENQGGKNNSEPANGAGTPTPTPNPLPRPEQSNQAAKSESNQGHTPTPQPQTSESTGNRMQPQPTPTSQPQATPTAAKEHASPNEPDENDRNKAAQDEKATSLQKVAQSRAPGDAIDKDALESILNILEDDKEAILQMRKQKARTIAEPEKGW